MTTEAPASPALKQTPFHDFHRQHNAQMVDFTGWSMPIRYDSIIAEHNQVRNSGGLFDVSHMGRLRFTGKDACRFLDRICTRQIHGMETGQARYGIVCNENGGCRDDVLVYKIAESEYLMVCNAANREKLLGHFDDVRGDLVFKLKDETESTAMIALQGPKVMDMLSAFSSEIPNLKRYRFTQKNLIFAKILVSRTGYTGEDGVEVIMPASIASKAVDLMLKKVDLEADDAIIKPCGLGARDSLRLEAAMALYGHEITEEIDPISAGLNFAVKLSKGLDDPDVEPFIGQEVLQSVANAGPKRKLIGLVLEGKRSARQDMAILRGDIAVGTVTSGCNSPTLGKCIAMGYVDSEHTEPGTKLTIDLGRARDNASVVPLPFYKK